MVEILQESSVPPPPSSSMDTEQRCPQDVLDATFSDVQRAAFLVDQALSHRLMPTEVLQHKNFSLAKQAFAINRRLRFFRYASLMTLSLLPFCEEPEWCSRKEPLGQCRYLDGYMFSGVMYLQQWTSTVIELCKLVQDSCCSCAVHMYTTTSCVTHFAALLPIYDFWEDRYIWIQVGLLGIFVLHIIVEVAAIPWLLLYQGRKVGIYLCILIPIFFSRSLRICFNMLLHIGHRVLDTAGLLVAFTLLSAWLANTLLKNDEFKDFPKSLLSLFIMLTTANNPNVWAKTYEENRITFFFFFMYMIIGFFFLLHLLFALIYNNYKVQLAEEVQRHITARVRNLRAAFDLLNFERDGITAKDAYALFFEIGRYRHIRDLSEMVEDILAGLKAKEQEKIIFSEFEALCSRYMKEVEARVLDVSVSFRDENNSRYCAESVVESVGYAWISFTATFASLVVAILEQNIRDSDTTNVSNWVPQNFIFRTGLLVKCEFVLGWVFLVDLVLRLQVKGVLEYLRSPLNRFDFVATLVIICLQISTLWDLNAYDWISVAIVLRSVKTVSLLNYFHRWRVMGRLLIGMIPKIAPILVFQFCVCALFSIAGVHLFGGLVFVGNPRLEGTEYADSGLWVYNYNDYGSAMVTSFNLCIVNNWYVIMDGYAAVTASAWSRSFFICFWAVAVALTLNVAVTFFIAAFTIQLRKAEQQRSLTIIGHPLSFQRAKLRRQEANMLVGSGGIFSKYDLYGEMVR